MKTDVKLIKQATTTIKYFEIKLEGRYNKVLCEVTFVDDKLDDYSFRIRDDAELTQCEKMHLTTAMFHLLYSSPVAV